MATFGDNEHAGASNADAVYDYEADAHLDVNAHEGSVSEHAGWDSLAPVTQIARAWVAERAAPELLPFEDHLFSSLQGLIEDQSDRIEDAMMAEASVQPETRFLATLLHAQIERVKYIMRMYLRARMIKIEKYALFIAKDDEQRRRLSPEEREFVEKYQRIFEAHMMRSCMSELPESLQSLDETFPTPSMLARPNLDQGVFIQVADDIGTYQIPPRADGSTVPNEEPVMDMDPGGLFLVRYSAVSSLILQRRVRLL